MSRFVLCVVAIGSLFFACKTEAPQEESPTAHASASAAATPANAHADANHVRIVSAPATGDVKTLVRDAALREKSQGRDLLVYVGATWCEPCRHFHAAAAHGDLDRDFPKLTLFEFDLDRDRDRLSSAGYRSEYIPFFCAPNPDGSPSNRRMEGSVKGDGAVAEITPRLRALLGR